MKRSAQGRRLLLVGIALASFSWVVYKMWTFNEWPQFFDCFKQNTAQFFLVLFFVFLLMVVNIGLEIRRWQLLVRPVASIAFWESMQQVIKGLQLGLITPVRSGDPIGKALFFDASMRRDVVLLSLVGSIIQTTVIFCFTLIAFAFAGAPGRRLLSLFRDHFWAVDNYLVYLGVLLLLSGGFISFRILKNKYGSIIGQLNLLNWFSVLQTIHIGVLTVIRYLVFSLQLLILLRFFEASTATTGFLSVFLFYGAITFFPSMGAGDLGIRSAVALLVFGETAVSGPGIILSTMIVWFINIALPALVPVFTGHFVEKKMVVGDPKPEAARRLKA
ncbi:hypothetical protein ACT29H_06405 [Thermophagus sp. OGC60D27]|uniref:hypothetical protein n=1 Tax=Thermophagus sp. OGC60D27 TaxID=3458415 RepID=UPI004038444F